MSKRVVQWLAILACAWPGTLLAQDLGALLPNGQSPVRSPLLERYTLPGENPGKLARGRLASALAGMDQPEPRLRLRGAHDSEIYRTLAPAVALILTDDSLGSASLIATAAGAGPDTRSGTLLTNAHVVGDAREVAVIFKPRREAEKIDPATALIGRVRKLDALHDLALVEVTGVPQDAVVIGRGTMDEVQVGADVHAIGHPVGETWTYTKGLVSQIRPGYEWTDAAGRHVADVIQTQTPINPGNSGGPLISDGGRLIGVNSFKKEGGEALNFAVSVGEVEKFLAAAQGGAFEPRVAAETSKPCRIKMTYEGRAPDNPAFIRNFDMNCSGRVNATLYVPDDEARPIVLRVDSNGDGKVDAWIFDRDRDTKWDISLWDTDFDGKPDLVGYHPDGALQPSRFEKYRPKS